MCLRRVAANALPIVEFGTAVSIDPLFPTLVQTMHGFEVPNTLPTGIELPEWVWVPPGLAGRDPSEFAIFAETANVTATITGDPHYYSFPLLEGEPYTFELLSETFKRRSNFTPFDGTLRVLEVGIDFQTGEILMEPVDYYGVDAEKFKALDAVDPSLVDLIWPGPGVGGLIETSMIVVEVSSGSGDYELLVHRMGIVPEPASLVLLAAGGGLLVMRSRVRMAS